MHTTRNVFQSPARRKDIFIWTNFARSWRVLSIEYLTFGKVLSNTVKVIVSQGEESRSICKNAMFYKQLIYNFEHISDNSCQRRIADSYAGYILCKEITTCSVIDQVVVNKLLDTGLKWCTPNARFCYKVKLESKHLTSQYSTKLKSIGEPKFQKVFPNTTCNCMYCNMSILSKTLHSLITDRQETLF